jgi:hypothetical protein
MIESAQTEATVTLVMPATEFRDRLSAILDQVESRQQTEPSFYAISQASLARIWEHPDEDVYTWEDGEPLTRSTPSF